MTSSEIVSPAKSSAKWESAAAWLIVLAFILINLVSGTRSPTVYMDEVEYTDPAANLFLGNGFTSTMWQQDRHEFWCGNVPLYQGMLYCFFKLFGFGLLQARMLSAVLAAAGALLVWGGLRRSGLIESPSWRLLSLALILSGSVSALTFRMARYDAAIFFVCALVFFACTLPIRWGIRYLAVLLASALLPFAGIAIIPYAGLLSVMYAFVYGRRHLALPAAVVAGLAFGVGGLFVFYRHFGVWNQFVEIVLPFTFLGSNAHSEARSLKGIVFGGSLGDENLITSFFGNPTRFLDMKTLFDYSAFLLFLVVIVIAFKIWNVAEARQRRLIVYILLVTLVTPPVMHLVGHYRSYYRWMTYVPLAIVTPRMLEMACRLGSAQLLRRAAVCIVCFSMLLGVPFRTLSAVPGWRARSVKPMERAAAEVVRPSDTVVCSYKAYYAIRPRAKVVYGFGLPARGVFELTKDFRPQDVTLLCALPEDRAKVFQAVGGDWEKVPLEDSEAATLARSRYPVEFYRRSANGNAK
jgi:hypothetical protein